MFSSLMFAPVCRFITEQAGSGSKARLLRSARKRRWFGQASGSHQNVSRLVPARGNRNCRNGFPHHTMGMAMARVRYTIIRVPASTLGEAHEIIGRMTGLGFPRERMNVAPHEDDTFHVAIHTRETDRDRVMDALHQTS